MAKAPAERCEWSWITIVATQGRVSGVDGCWWAWMAWWAGPGSVWEPSKQRSKAPRAANAHLLVDELTGGRPRKSPMPALIPGFLAAGIWGRWISEGERRREEREEGGGAGSLALLLGIGDRTPARPL